MKQERLREIDILRAIAFIFVVVQHTLGGYSNIEGIPYNSFIIMKLMYIMATPAVPIFLFISAVSLFYAHSKKFDWKSYYLKRVKYILVPYIIWSAINMIELGNEERFKDFIMEVLGGNGGFHLWYMGTVIRIFLFFPIILWIVKKVHLLKVKFRIGIFILLSAIYYLILKFQGAISDNLGQIIFGAPTEIQQRLIDISPLFWYIYFLIGICFILNYEYIKRKVIKYKSVIFASHLLLFLYSYLNEIGMIDSIKFIYLCYMVISIIGFYLTAVKLAEKNIIYKIFKFIGDYSFGAYMAHIIVVNYISNEIIIELETRNYLFVGVLTLITTVIVTPLFMKIISYLPFSEYVTGAKRSRLNFEFNMELSKGA
jgi:peptidoglycan/LPS O-acetylase OafA/YrhL